MSHNAMHEIKDGEVARNESKKNGRRKLVRDGRSHSNSMWHTDYKQIEDGRWFLCYGDDASRFVTRCGVFEYATTENVLAVLDKAIKDHGKPASVVTDHGSQLYPNGGTVKRRGSSNLRRGW